MANAWKVGPACVRFADPASPEGIEVSTAEFLDDCRRSAQARFRRPGTKRARVQTVEHPVPPKARDTHSTGLIVAHVSSAAWKAWERVAPPDVLDRHAHVESELHLALEDLADQDMHGYLALTETQCEFYGPDLGQLVSESLERTSFSHVGRASDPRWEGTLVERVRPPFLVLAVSIGLAAAPEALRPRKAGRSRARRNATLGTRAKVSRQPRIRRKPSIHSKAGRRSR